MTTLAFQRAISRVEANVDNYIVHFVVMIAHGYDKTLSTLCVLVRRNNVATPLLLGSKLSAATVSHTVACLGVDLIKPRNPAVVLMGTIRSMVKIFHPETRISVTHQKFAKTLGSQKPAKRVFEKVR